MKNNWTGSCQCIVPILKSTRKSYSISLLFISGVSLQVETLNSFLDFVGYHGVGLVDNAAKDPEVSQTPYF